MTQCKLNDQVLHGAGIKVTVKVQIRYEWIAELRFDEDEVEQVLLTPGWHA